MSNYTDWQYGEPSDGWRDDWTDHGRRHIYGTSITTPVARRNHHAERANPKPFDLRWQADAACRTVGVEVMFPDYYAGMSRQTKAYMEAPARALCAECPCRAACLDHAIRHEPAGIWGGKNAWEREAMRQKRRVA